MPWGGAPKCPACDRTVYPMDQIVAADRKPFHARCIQCQMIGCGADLTARSLKHYEGYVICEKCYDSLLHEKVYGPGEGQESIDERRRREEEERLARERAEKSRKERRCMECDKKTFPDDSEELAPGFFYHKGCMKCKECGRAPDEDTPLLMAPREAESVFGPEILDPYCKYCYAKIYKMSALAIQEMVTIAPDMVIGL